jgi:hypothetical protein
LCKTGHYWETVTVFGRRKRQAIPESPAFEDNAHGGATAGTKPYGWFDFEVAVGNGTYDVRAELSERYAATSQQIKFENVDAGTYELPREALCWTEEEHVAVRYGRLRVRKRLRDDRTPAGVPHLVFMRIP